MIQERGVTASNRRTPILDASSALPLGRTPRVSIFPAGRDLAQHVSELTPEKQMELVDAIDQMDHTLDSQNAESIATLGDICCAIERLPTAAVLSGLKKHGNIPVASGGFTDIWQGELGDARVAVKAFRLHAQNLKEAKKILWKRVPTWKRLFHSNILPFRGVNMTHFQLALVYDWGERGNITEYITSHPRVSRPSLLSDVAKGLEYLHGLDIVHGDLKGGNVIVNHGGHAQLTEYGLTPISFDPAFGVAAVPGSIWATRWLAPELITPSPEGVTMPAMEMKTADIFAFAMLAVEVFTGGVPFDDKRWNESVVLLISRGGRPRMPKNAHAVGLTAEMWELLQSCWHQDPKKRPMIEGVVRRWQEFIGNDNTSEVSLHKEEPGGCTRQMAKALQHQTRAETLQPRIAKSGIGPSRKVQVKDPSSRKVVFSIFLGFLILYMTFTLIL